MNKDAKIYIAGHKGLVGSAIIKNLELKGYNNFITRTHKELDLINQEQVATFFKKVKPEYVFLAAAKVGGIAANNEYRGNFIYENLMIQNNVIHQSYIHKVKKLLFLGSTCIYPKNCPQPIKEEYLLTDTLEYTNEPYAVAKIAGIKMCENYNIQYGTNFISVQPTNLYGPNDNFDLEKSHVLPALIRKIHLGKSLENNNWLAIQKNLDKLPIEGVNGSNSKIDILRILEKYGVRFRNDIVEVEIWGTGSPMREFLWSGDMADACVFLMENINFSDLVENVKEIRSTHINIGTGKEVSIKTLSEMIKKTINFKGNLYFNSDKPEGAIRKLTETKKLSDLGWKYKVNLPEGIQKLYSDYKFAN